MTLTLTILYRYYAHSMDVVWHLLEDVGSLAQGHTRPMPQDKCTRSLRWEPTTSPTVGFLHQFTTPWDWFPVLLVGRALCMTYYLLVTSLTHVVLQVCILDIRVHFVDTYVYNKYITSTAQHELINLISKETLRIEWLLTSMGS